MTSAVFDCNIFLQALLNPHGIAAKCLDLVKTGSVRLFVSKDTLAGVNDVLFRPNILAKFPDISLEKVKAFIESITEITLLEKQIPKSFYFQRDPKDEMIIDLALFCKTDFIVSRDKDLLDLMTDISIEAKEFRQKSRPLKIVEPIEFLRILEKKDLPLNP
jgi:putative PIN family toxin of toxin-antitoxin system